MHSLKLLEQQKAELDLKISQSLEMAKKMSLDLEQARVRHQAIERGASEIKSVMEKYNLSQEDIFPSAQPKGTAAHKSESKTLSEMRTYFNRR